MHTKRNTAKSMLIIFIIYVCMLISGSIFHFFQYVCEIICTYVELECKSRKSRDTRSNLEPSLVLETKWSRTKAIEFCQENALIIANTLFQQHKRRLYTWTSLDGQHQNQIDYIFAAKDGEALYSQKKKKKKTRPRADSGSDHELLIAKFSLNWRK